MQDGRKYESREMSSQPQYRLLHHPACHRHQTRGCRGMNYRPGTSQRHSLHPQTTQVCADPVLDEHCTVINRQKVAATSDPAHLHYFRNAIQCDPYHHFQRIRQSLKLQIFCTSVQYVHTRYSIIRRVRNRSTIWHYGVFNPGSCQISHYVEHLVRFKKNAISFFQERHYSKTNSSSAGSQGKQACDLDYMLKII